MMSSKKLLSYCLKILFLTGMIGTTNAEPLSNKALYHRCYRQITQSFPDPASSLTSQVVSGQVSAIDACMSVLNRANFTANSGNKIGNTDPLTLKVLRNFQNIHYSFFSQRIFDDGAGYWGNTRDSVDVNGPGLYFTKALFTPNYQFSNIFSGTTNYESLRTTANPTSGPFTGKDKAYFLGSMGTDVSPTWQQTGDLLGIRPFTVKSFPYKKAGGNLTMHYDTNFGGGVIGSSAYMHLNIRHNRLYSDGAVRVPRKWAQSVYLDFLCRDLPVVRYEDSQSYVSSSSPITFRNDAACTRCHVSMDRMAGVIRNSYSGVQYPTGGGGSWMDLLKLGTSASAAEIFPTTSDSNYYKRPTDGYFYFRSHDGILVNQKVSGPPALGSTIASIDAPYVCMAKRYYKYFTGIDVNVDDIADPQYGRTLNANELVHRKQVIDMGKNFKTHQSLKKLIEEIFRKPQFRDSAYKITN